MTSLESNLATLLEKIWLADLKLRLIKPRRSCSRPCRRLAIGRPTLFPTRREVLMRGRPAAVSAKSSRWRWTASTRDRRTSTVRPVPSWYALSRMQREIVEQTLERLAAEHRANAARKNLLRDQGAQAEYGVADAFRAAMEALAFEPLNVPGSEWEPLAATTDPATSNAKEPSKRQPKAGNSANDLGPSVRRAPRKAGKKRRRLNPTTP
jgi:hypothetical protein